MGRIMGIDYGRKRTGVAVTDPLKIIAGNLATVPSHTLLQFIKDYIAREDVECIVVGQPTQLNGEPSESMRYIMPFVNRLRKELPEVPVVMYDERFTSAIAHQAMIDGGMKKSDRRDKSKVDAIAATIILNDYLQSKLNQPETT
ncbi:MAG: Holliday junction resolvase RuvX [Muribaculaceae bacterium]|nr:Holliday junction resolvase RuvX [Muribaculaceae bacterium]